MPDEIKEKMPKKNMWMLIILGVLVLILIVVVFIFDPLNLFNRTPISSDPDASTSQAASSSLADSTIPSSANETTTLSPSSGTTSGTSQTESSTTVPESTTDKYDMVIPAVIAVDPDTWYLTLVNKFYSLPADWEPPSLELVPDGKLASAGKGYMDSRAQIHYADMYNAAKADGVTLKPLSAYREYDFQVKLFDKQIKKQMAKGYSEKRAKFEAAQVVAQPGTSDHQLGLGIDIGWTGQDFQNSNQFKWLDKHGQDYGFVIRYPKDKTNITYVQYEPWHWRFVGVEAARKMKSAGQCLEEYLGKVK